MVTGIQDVNAQSLALEINEEVLHSQVLNYDNPVYIRQGNTTALKQLLTDMNAGKVGVLITSNVNPLYTLPAADAMAFESGLSKVGTSVAFTLRADETALKTNYLAAAPHSSIPANCKRLFSNGLERMPITTNISKLSGKPISSPRDMLGKKRNMMDSITLQKSVY